MSRKKRGLSWKFWKKAPAPGDRLDQIQFEIYQEAMRLEKLRSKRKRIYEVWES
jgi:hypothetical protein